MWYLFKDNSRLREKSVWVEEEQKLTGILIKLSHQVIVLATSVVLGHFHLRLKHEQVLLQMCDLLGGGLTAACWTICSIQLLENLQGQDVWSQDLKSPVALAPSLCLTGVSEAALAQGVIPLARGWQFDSLCPHMNWSCSWSPTAWRGWQNERLDKISGPMRCSGLIQTRNFESKNCFHTTNVKFYSRSIRKWIHTPSKLKSKKKRKDNPGLQSLRFFCSEMFSSVYWPASKLNPEITDSWKKSPLLSLWF